MENKSEVYFISDECIGCKRCIEVCPQKCILSDKIPFLIEQEHCLHCGNCMTVCPVRAVKKESNSKF